MDRRNFVALVVASPLLLSSQIGSGQTGGRTYRVGVLAPDLSDANDFEWNEFVAELARRGYVERSNIVFERRFGESGRPELLDSLAAELVRLKVDVIYAARGTSAALAAKKATTIIPIVFYSSADPVGLGLVASLAHPGSNVTGSAILTGGVSAKSLQYLAEAAGKLTKVAFIHPSSIRSFPWYAGYAAELTAAANALDAKSVFVDIDMQSISEMESVVKRLARQGVDGAMLISGSREFVPYTKRIAALFVAYRLPSIGNPSDGFLLGYGIPDGLVARTAARNVDKILKGTEPFDLPVEQVAVFELVINLETAKALGITIPRPLLLRADQVIQ